MAGEVQPELFESVNDFAADIRKGSYNRNEELDLDWEIFTFCQLFFDQFFGEFGVNISGFEQRSRESAAELIEGLRAAGRGTQEARALIVLYEEFCDMSDDAHGGYGDAAPIDLLTFHQDYLSMLLDAAHRWAKSEGRGALEASILAAINAYNSAIEDSQWLIR